MLLNMCGSIIDHALYIAVFTSICLRLPMLLLGELKEGIDEEVVDQVGHFCH